MLLLARRLPCSPPELFIQGNEKIHPPPPFIDTHPLFFFFLNYFCSAADGLDLLRRVPLNGETAALVKSLGEWWSHTYLFETVRPHGRAPEPGGDEFIEGLFESRELLSSLFKEVVRAKRGYGWVWLGASTHPALAKDAAGLSLSDPARWSGAPTLSLSVLDLPEQQPCVTMPGLVPILGLDLWEHAYSLDFGADKDAYVDAFFKSVDWHKVAEHSIAWNGDLKAPLIPLRTPEQLAAIEKTRRHTI